MNLTSLSPQQIASGLSAEQVRTCRLLNVDPVKMIESMVAKLATEPVGDAELANALKAAQMGGVDASQIVTLSMEGGQPRLVLRGDAGEVLARVRGVVVGADELLAKARAAVDRAGVPNEEYAHELGEKVRELAGGATPARAPALPTEKEQAQIAAALGVSVDDVQKRATGARR